MILTHHGINSLNGSTDPVYGTITIGDHEYRTVIIGNQEWIVENLDWALAGLDKGAAASSHPLGCG